MPQPPSLVAAATTTPLVVTVAIGAFGACAAVIAAIIAGASAISVKRSETTAQRIRDLENRIFEPKRDAYRPMIEKMSDIFDPDKAALNALDPTEFNEMANQFMIRLTMFGSDEAIKAFHKVTQAAVRHAPDRVVGRLFVDFVISVRRDIGYPGTKVTPLDIFGMRAYDLYSTTEVYESMHLSFVNLCNKDGWSAPWEVEDRQSLNQ